MVTTCGLLRRRRFAPSERRRSRRAKLGVSLATVILVCVAIACSRSSEPPSSSATVEAVVHVPAPAPSTRSQAPVAAEDKRLPFAPRHPLLESLLAPFQQATGDGGPPENTTIDEAACHALVPFREAPIDHCSIDLLANGTAPVVAVVSGCGQHVCDVRYYVWYGTRREPYPFDPAGSLVTLEVSPDHRYLLIGEIEYSEEEYPAVPQQGRTLRLEFATGHRSVVADCLSPRLSPEGHWYVCRNLQGDVLRFPVDFGPLSTVVKAQLPAGDAVKVGGPFEDFPAPVEFIAPGRLRYSLYLRNAEEVVEREAGFVE